MSSAIDEPRDGRITSLQLAWYSTIVGYGDTPLGAEALRWTSDGGMLALGDLPGSLHFSRAYDVSADGAVVVGSSYAGSGVESRVEAFRWTADEGMVGLGDIRGGHYSVALGVSGDGSVVVGWSGDGAFRWTAEGGMVGLRDLAGNRGSRATDVSADGSIIVGVASYATGSEAFIWDAENGMRRLDIVLTGLDLDLTGWTLRHVSAISDDGRTIVGTGTNPSGLAESWIAVIPEPATGALLGAGLVVLGFQRSRTRCRPSTVHRCA